MIGKAFTLHVNARSASHDPNHVLDRDPKRLSERDSSPCEHSHCLPIYESVPNVGDRNGFLQVAYCIRHIFHVQIFSRFW